MKIQVTTLNNTLVSFWASLLEVSHILRIYILGMNNILPEKSVDICFILFGFLLTVLALIVQGDNQTLKRLRSFDGYGRIIRFNRRVVILSTILGLFSLLICTILEENLPIIANHILFSIFTFLWIWLLWDFGVFIKVFYNIIIKAK